MKILSIIGAIMAMSSLSFAHNTGVLKVKAKSMTCSELQELVDEEGHVHIRGFGSLDVFSTERACKRHFGYYFEGERSNWSTSDKTFCFAGYKCVENNDDDN